jgi:hypothetical protein
MADNTGTAALELLRFRPALAATYGFESALRARVERLDRFRHPAFPHVHAVEYLDEGDGLALVTTHTPGKRVAELLPPPSDWPRRPYTPRAEAHPAFAAWLIRQITSAIAELQAQGHEIAHGALTADRIILTPDRRVVVVEHVLGSALASIELSADSLWAQVGVVPERPFGTPLLDLRADVVQIGLVSLAVLLGRRITPAEYPSRLPQLLDEFSEVAGRRSQGLADPLRIWLEQALRTDGRGFRSAKDARGGLGELPDPAVAAGQASLRKPAAPLAPPPVAPAAAATPLAPSAITPPRVAAPRVTAPPVTAPPAIPPAAAPSVTPPPAAAPAVAAPHMADAGPTQILGLRNAAAFERTGFEPALALPAERLPIDSRTDELDQYRTIEERLRQPAETARPRTLAPKLAAGFAALSLLEAVALGAVLVRRPASAPVATEQAAMPVQVAAGDGEVVLIDGRAASSGRVELQPSPDGHTITVFHRAPPSQARLPRAAPANAAQLSAIAEAAGRQRPGGLKLVAPVEMQVVEGDRVLGTSADGPVVTTAGPHQLEFVNAAIGYRSRQTVNIKAGQIVSLALTPPAGRVSINAVPWAQVWIDGRAVGETPLANVSVAAGEHDIVFRHPRFGEHREKTTVKSGALTRVSATLGR